MKRYLTEYRVGIHRYGGDIWCKSPEDAERIAKARCIGEKVISNGGVSGGLGRPRTKIQKLHEAVYLSWIAMEMGAMTPKQALGDQSLVHEMIHNLQSPGKVKTERRFRALQNRIPGHRP